jgi:hypothetical protein
MGIPYIPFEAAIDNQSWQSVSIAAQGLLGTSWQNSTAKLPMTRQVTRPNKKSRSISFHADQAAL